MACSYAGGPLLAPLRVLWSLLGSPPRLRRGDGMKCTHGLWPRGGAGAQPPHHQGRSCGAGPATWRQWFPGVLIATRCLTDMLLPESSSSWEAATPSFQCLRLQTSDSPLAPFFPNPPHLSPPTCWQNLWTPPAEYTQNPTTSPHLQPAHPVPAYMCSAAPPTSHPLHTASHRKSEYTTSSPHWTAKSVP